MITTGFAQGELRRLREAAIAACANAYAPYSNFRVGAACISASGKIFTGVNVENASYGLTVCAERNAVFQAVAAGERDIVAIAIYTPTATPTTPCGACRQVLSEFGKDIAIVCCCDGPDVHEFTIAQLLPHGFRL
ncbi:MAG: cytidine deaminase [Betaproteobacteria bacterium]